MLIELFGTVAMILAITGVVLNNRLRRECFIIFMVSNTLCLTVHVSVQVWSMVLMDAIFLFLAFEGWWRWGKNGIKATKK